MEAVFAKLVSISIVANWLILAVILLRVLLKEAPRWITCILWALVAVRLVFPFSIESPVSLIPETTSVIQEAVDTNLIHPEVVPSDTAVFPAQEENSNPYIGSKPSVSIIPFVWYFGVSLMLCYLVFSYFKMLWLVREAVPEREKIWVCDAVTTPFILGIIRPKIYLPSGLLEPNREYVIAHEQSHLRCKDHWWKPMAFVLLSVFWFDPLMWIAYTLVCRDIEFACDERVVHHYGLPEKKAYSEALLECSSNRKLVLACPVAFGETAVIQRVRNVLNYKRPRFWVILICIIVIVVTAIGFLTVPAKKDTSDPVYKHYLSMNQKTEIINRSNGNASTYSTVTVKFLKTSGPSVVHLELWYQTESDTSWVEGAPIALDVAGSASFVIPANCDSYAIMATGVEGKNGDASFLISEPAPKLTDKKEDGYSTVHADKTVETPSSADETGEENLVPLDAWDRYPDGIQIEPYVGQTFTAHVMIVRDPSKVYLAASSNPLSMDTPGTRMDETMEREKAIAAVNAGPFFDDGTASRAVGSVPSGLALSEDAVIWNDQQISEYGFVGFNKDNILIVASSMTETEAKEQGVRDGCSSGPVLMINGEPNMEVYNENSGYNPRTAVGQRSDGAVVFICADGRNPDSLGATYADIIDILTEYGAVNACALNGGSSSAMLYRDADGRYSEKEAIQILNRNGSSSIRRMPTFWMVKSAG